MFYNCVSIFGCTKASVNLSSVANFILFNSIEWEKRSELFEKVYTSIQHLIVLQTKGVRKSIPIALELKDKVPV